MSRSSKGVATAKRSKTGAFSYWLRELRAPFFTASIVPITLGAAVAWNYFGSFSLWTFLLSLAVTLCLHAGANVVNDYFDYENGCDIVNKEFIPMFSGGSRLLVEGILSPNSVYIVAIGFFVVGVLSSLILFFVRGWIVLGIVAMGAITGYFYTKRIATRGLGELCVGLDFGPLAVTGSYFVQTGVLDFNPIWASIPVGLMIANILWINEVPDIPADKKVGKKTLVARMGKRKAIQAFKAILILTYLSIGMGVLFNLLPLLCLITFLTVPLAVKAIRSSSEHVGTGRPLAPANVAMVKIHLVAGLLLSAAFTLSRLLAGILP
nr:1,4-dihydroxy-2-naphthoate octaprenyltransferase [Candidatus Njordarchaeota archaeon]